MDHNVRVPAHLSDPGISDWQCWATIASSLLVGFVVGCVSTAYAGLVAGWLVQVAWVIGMCVHRHRRLRAAYHAQRRRHP